MCLFLSVFADQYHEHICAEIGLHGSIMGDVPLHYISTSGADLDIQRVAPPRVLDMAATALNGKPAELLR